MKPDRAIGAAGERLAIAAVAVSFAAGVALTWHRLGNLFLDCGRELELPRRLLDGGVLYRDVRYYWGPLAPYLNAALFGVFGVSLETARWAGIASAALACAGLYLLVRRLAGPLAAAAVAIAFVHECAFAMRDLAGIFNFVVPFNYSATYGMTAAIWSVYLLVAHARGGRTAPLAGAVAALAVTWLTKAEVAFAASAAHAAFVLSGRRTLSRRHLAAYGAGAAAVLAVYAGFLAAVGPDLWWSNLAALGNPASSRYVAVTMGLDDGPRVALDVAASALLLGGLFAVAAALSRRPGLLASAPPLAPALVAGSVAFVSALALPFRTTLRALPLVLAAAVGGLVLARLRRGDGLLDGRWREHLACWTFGLACLARIPLRVGPEHYGFFLIPAALASLAVLYLEVGPRLGGGPAGRATFRAIGYGLLGGLVAGSLWITVQVRAVFSRPLAGKRGEMLLPPNAPEHALVPFLSRESVRSAIAIPNGAGVFFLSGIPVADDTMTSYLPMEIPDEGADLRLVQRWEANPPDVVLYWQQDLRTDFGYAGFGIDYAVRSRNWLFENYRPATDPRTGMFLMVRQAVPRPAR
jgi:hypothetical protein